MCANKFNKIWQKEEYPAYWKSARLAPILNEGKYLSSSSGYRPIFSLPFWGKLLDRILVKRLMGFLKDNSLLYKEHFGFRRALLVLYIK